MKVIALRHVLMALQFQPKKRYGWRDRWSVVSTWCSAISPTPKLEEIMEWDRTSLPNATNVIIQNTSKRNFNMSQEKCMTQEECTSTFSNLLYHFQFLSTHIQTIQMDKESHCTWKSFCMKNVWRNIYTIKVHQQPVCKQ